MLLTVINGGKVARACVCVCARHLLSLVQYDRCLLTQLCWRHQQKQQKPTVHNKTLRRTYAQAYFCTTTRDFQVQKQRFERVFKNAKQRILLF